MRLVYFLILLCFLVVIGIFAYQNDEPVTLNFLREHVALHMSLLLLGVYVFGMLSGWTVVGFIKRSFERVTERDVR
jgi:uncharacterized integral membrane protein